VTRTGGDPFRLYESIGSKAIENQIKGSLEHFQAAVSFKNAEDLQAIELLVVKTGEDSQLQSSFPKLRFPTVCIGVLGISHGWWV
jgi:hypothetical protein